MFGYDFQPDFYWTFWLWAVIAEYYIIYML